MLKILHCLVIVQSHQLFAFPGLSRHRKCDLNSRTFQDVYEPGLYREAKTIKPADTTKLLVTAFSKWTLDKSNALYSKPVTDTIIKTHHRWPRAGSGVVRIDLFSFLAGCRTRRLNQALSVLYLSKCFYCVVY